MHVLISCTPASPKAMPKERTVDDHVSKLRRKLEDVGVRGIPARPSAASATNCWAGG